MDRKGIIILIISFVLLVLWVPLTNFILPPQPAPIRTNTPSSATNQPPPATNVGASANVQSNQTPPRIEQPLVRTNIPEETLVVENEDARYTFTSHGGGLKEAELKGYPETVACGAARKAATTNKWATLNQRSPLPALAVLGGEIVQGDGVFRLTKTANGVRAEKETSGGLYVVKEFQLTSNYLIAATVRFENRSSQPVAVPAQKWIVGTATPIARQDELPYHGVYWYDGRSDVHVAPAWFENKTLGCLAGTPRPEYQAGASNVAWAAVHNQFFTLALIPKDPAGQIEIVKTNLPAPSREEIAANPKQIHQPFALLTSVVYPPTVLGTNQTLERVFHLYAGPKEYNTLARIGAQFKNNLDEIMGFDEILGGRFFGFFAKLLLLSMNGLHALGLSYALAIIAITVVIKLLFWPLTQASTRSMKRMATLQPQMKALQEKFKDDPVKMNRKLMEFMKEHKVSPLGGCLPMLLQIPVFIGFYKMIQTAIELRGAQFLWACDLTKPDTVFTVPGLSFIPFIGIPGVGLPINPLPLLMGVTMLWQARLTPPSPGMDPMQQKIMKYMPLMFLFILYNFSAGLTLYWTVQNLLTIAQMKLTKAKEQPAGTAPKGPPAKQPPPGGAPKKKKL
jgi:YidC/Oxa1 family membrane protein insertase